MGLRPPPSEIRVVLTYDERTSNVSLTANAPNITLLLGILAVGQQLAAQQLKSRPSDGDVVVARGPVPSWPGRKQ